MVQAGFAFPKSSYVQQAHRIRVSGLQQPASTPKSVPCNPYRASRTTRPELARRTCPQSNLVKGRDNPACVLVGYGCRRLFARL